MLLSWRVDTVINQVFNQCCLEGMACIPSKSIDITLTSPPYDNLRNYNGSLNWSFEIFQSVANELFRITKDGGVVVWVVGDATINGSETGTSFRQALYFKDVGFRLHDTMIYKKRNPVPLTHNRLDPCFEYIFCLSKGSPKTFYPLTEPTLGAGGVRKRHQEVKAAIDRNSATRYRNEETIVKEKKYKTNILEYSVGVEQKTDHPAIFPVALAQDQIIMWSNEGDTIFDPFMGSGTTAIACINTGRNYIGFEKEEKYYQIIQERIKNHKPQLKMAI